MTSDPKGTAATEPAGDRVGRESDLAARLVARVTAELQTRLAAPLDPGLYLVATPIGNLGDVTMRALVVLARADEVYCEDTRQSAKLLARYGLDRRLGIYHEHNAERERPRILARLADGHAVALISDAGTPLISDPGFKLARHAIEAGYAVIALPGASATLTALAVSGLPTDSFYFGGFLPTKAAARRRRIEQLAAIPATLILFEGPSRIAEALADLAAVLGERPAGVARELTKLHEEVLRGTLGELARSVAERGLKGEIVVVVGPPLTCEVRDDDIIAGLTDCLAEGTLRDCAADVASRLGVAKSRVYDLGLALKRSLRQDPDQ